MLNSGLTQPCFPNTYSLYSCFCCNIICTRLQSNQMRISPSSNHKHNPLKIILFVIGREIVRKKATHLVPLTAFGTLSVEPLTNNSFIFKRPIYWIPIIINGDIFHIFAIATLDSHEKGRSSS